MSALGGIDLGGTKVQAVVVDGAYAVIGDARRPTPTTGGPAEVAAAMAATLAEAAAQAGTSTGELAAVGVGSPGAIDPAAGTVSGAGNLPGWAGSYPLRDVLAEGVGAPVALGNDVSVAVDAEFHLGAAREYRSLLGVFWGTGVGGGIVIDGKAWVGRGSAAEIGHVVVKIDGARCPCGRRGCLEAYAGRGAMERRARELVEEGRETVLFEIMEERGRPRLTSGIWKRALDRGDAVAGELMERAVRALGAGVASAQNLLDVEAIVIGGGLGLKLGEPWVERLREAMQPHLFVDERPPVVELAALGDLGGAIGAALLGATEHAPELAPA
jgi:glucokinase